MHFKNTVNFQLKKGKFSLKFAKFTPNDAIFWEVDILSLSYSSAPPPHQIMLEIGRYHMALFLNSVPLCLMLLLNLLYLWTIPLPGVCSDISPNVMYRVNIPMTIDHQALTPFLLESLLYLNPGDIQGCNRKKFYGGGGGQSHFSRCGFSLFQANKKSPQPFFTSFFPLHVWFSFIFLLPFFIFPLSLSIFPLHVHFSYFYLFSLPHFSWLVAKNFPVESLCHPCLLLHWRYHVCVLLKFINVWVQ